MGLQPAAGLRTPAPRSGLPGCPPPWAFGLRKSYKKMRMKTILVSLRSARPVRACPAAAAVTAAVGARAFEALTSPGITRWVQRGYAGTKVKNSLLGMRSCCIRRGCWAVGRHQVKLMGAPCTLSSGLPALLPGCLVPCPQCLPVTPAASAPPSAGQGCSLQPRSQDLSLLLTTKRSY